MNDVSINGLSMSKWTSIAKLLASVLREANDSLIRLEISYNWVYNAIFCLVDAHRIVTFPHSMILLLDDKYSFET